MKLYAAADEARIRAAAQVRAWTHSGLLNASQGAAIESGLRTELRQTNRYLRFALFVFGTIVVWAAMGLSLLLLDTRRDAAIGWTAIVAGAIDLALARFLVARFRLYRFGIEEALAIWSVVFVACGAGFLTSRSSNGDIPAVVACLAAALASAIAYWLFGYLYAACAGIAALAATPFWLGVPGFAARLIAAVILVGAFVVARTWRRPRGDDFPGDDYGVIEAVAWGGCYAVLNLRLSFDLMPSFLGASAREVPSAFYWATYVAIWLLPLAGLAIAVRDTHRPMIWSGLVTALATLVTNKAYLGWERHTWDPILLGVLLVGVAVVIRRWLASGRDGHRAGFTPQSLVASGDQDRLGVLASLAGAAQPFAVRTPSSAPAFDAGRGGRSGGAGGGTDF